MELIDINGRKLTYNMLQLKLLHLLLLSLNSAKRFKMDVRKQVICIFYEILRKLFDRSGWEDINHFEFNEVNDAARRYDFTEFDEENDNLYVDDEI